MSLQPQIVPCVPELTPRIDRAAAEVPTLITQLDADVS